MAYDYDLFVIGAGSGGVRAARMSATYGARVAVAEEYRVGGTCVIRGCVPKKLFVYASQYSEHFRDAAGFGWQVGESRFNWRTLIDAKDREIDRLNSIYIRNLKASGVEIIPSRAIIRDPHTIYLTDEDREVTTGTILIATGATPFLPEDTPGIEHAITSNEAFHLEELPEHIVIVGGGYIAVEFAGIFNGLGVATTLVYRGSEILRGFDDDLRTQLHTEMVAKGIDVRVMSDVAEIIKGADGRLDIGLKSGDRLDSDLIMYATGRVPNVKGLGLSENGVNMGWNGYVIVDEYNRSSVENIYAVGDVTHRVNLTPVAIREGAAFAETMYNNNPTTVDYSDIPTAVFSQPEIGTVGLTEELARERYPNLLVFKEHFRPMKNTLSGSEEKILLKLLVCGDSDKVVGCHFMGPDAGELVQLAGVAMKAGVSKADFDRTIAVHPSAAEELVLMRTPRKS